MELSRPDQQSHRLKFDQWWMEIRILARSMRVRLALGYCVAGDSVLLGSGLAFRVALDNSIKREARALLTERWGAVRGICISATAGRCGFTRRGDAVQVESVNRLRRRLLIADANANLLEISERFPSPNLETRSALRSAAVLKEPAFEERTDIAGQGYMIRRGPVPHGDTLLVLALAEPLERIHRESRLMLKWYFWSLPVLLGLLGGVSWHMAGRALLPLRQLAKAAEVVSSENAVPAHLATRSAR